MSRLKSVKELNEIINNPDGSYRSAPFWGWNDRIQPEQINFQLEEMKKQGMGGVFIHSREGLETPYLSEEWMERVGQSIEKAKQEAMEVWIYDEDKWPSGSAGGMVSAKNPELYTAKGLTFECRTPASEKKENLDQEKILGIYPYKDNQEIVLRMETSASSEWYNNLAPSDNLCPKAVQEFMELTHKQYEARFGNEFGKTVKGFFTDEPNCFDFFSFFTPGRPWVQWSAGFEDYFQEKRGYNIMPYLPFLFVDDFECDKPEMKEKVRHDFWRSISDRFGESYMKQIYDYCSEHHMVSTGHILYENDLGYQTRVCGAAMPQYRYLHAPGIDILGEQTKEYLTVKQCTSVANQYDRDMTITETYGCTGWDFSFQGQKMLADWQFVMGITRRCQHLALYSITGCRKRDYPPVFNYQTSWWNDNHYMEDYFGRLTAAVSTGSVVRNILVIHPMSTIWSKCRSSADENLNNMEMNMGWKDEQFVSLNKLGEEYNRLAKMLLEMHEDFDFGDETILSEIGVVSGNRLKVGKADYGVIIVPKVETLFESTLKLLEEYAMHGGVIIWVTPYPSMMEGLKTDKTKDYVNQIQQGIGFSQCQTYAQIPTLLTDLHSEKLISITGPDYMEQKEILSMLRKTEDGYVLFLVNNDCYESHSVLVKLPAGKITECNLFSGERTEIAGKLLEDAIQDIPPAQIEVNFTPGESHLFLVEADETMKQAEVKLPYVHPHAAEEIFAVAGPTLKYKRTMPNVLTLDKCSYKLGADVWSDTMDVWQAQRQIREKLDMQQVYYNGAPQRYSWIFETDSADILSGKRTAFELKFEFDVQYIPEKPCYIVVEKPEKLYVTLNDLPCLKTKKYFMDQDMICFEVQGLRTGIQELVIGGNYAKEMELEDIFLIGEFAVSVDRVVVKEKETLHLGDFCYQGLYHYPGSVICEFSIPAYEEELHEKKVFLQCGAFSGSLVKVFVNHQEAGILLNADEKCNLTKYLKEEENLVGIELVGSPRNMFGPFHQKYTGCSRISWADFRTEGAYYTEDYVIKPFGLMNQINITIEGE